MAQYQPGMSNQSPPQGGPEIWTQQIKKKKFPIWLAILLGVLLTLLIAGLIFWLVKHFNPFDVNLRERGAKQGDITISIEWDSIDDIDLHCITPGGSEIYYNNRTADGGELDVDTNASGIDDSELISQGAVENIYFLSPQSGEYTVVLHNYKDRTPGSATDIHLRITEGKGLFAKTVLDTHVKLTEEDEESDHFKFNYR